MRLYVLRERTGTLINSPRRPWEPSDEEVAEVREEYAGLPPWLLLPDEYYLPGGPSLKTIMEWAFYYHVVARFAFGKNYVEVQKYVNSMVRRNACEYYKAMKRGKLVAKIGPAFVASVAVYIFNPKIREFVHREESPFRYIGRYQEDLDWFDLVEVSKKGRFYYQRCANTKMAFLFEYINEHFWGGVADRWEFGGTWIQEKWQPLFYSRYLWETAWVEFIGYLTRVSTFRYVLQEQYTDSYAAELSRPWYVDPDKKCRAAIAVP